MKKRTRTILIVILILAAAVCAGAAVGTYVTQRNAGQGYEDVREEVREESTEETKTEETEEETEAETETEHTVDVPIDFEKLWERNPEAYAWIEIPGTEIDYPILHREGDDSYYLTHDIDGETATEGAIYTEDYNGEDFSDANTVIYGHNMKNGTMFRGLHAYEDRAFFKENQEVLIYQPGRILHYQIFAAYTYDNRHLMQSFDFSDPDVFESYVSQILSKKDMSSNVDDTVSISEGDKIITLSTCNGNKEQRYLVQAVLVSIEE